MEYGCHKVEVKDGNKTRHTLEPDPPGLTSRQTVKRIFAMTTKGIGTKEIAKTLNSDCLRTSTGARWTKTYVHKILTNEAYCGTLVLGGRPCHEAIHNGEPRVLPSFYLLSGLLYCSCGKAMIGRSAKSHRFYYYTCNRSFKQGSDACGARSLPKAKLEQIVTGHIKSKVLKDEVLESKLPVPAHWQERDDVVLPIVPLGGAWGTVPELLFEKKRLIPALQQLLISSGKFVRYVAPGF